MVAIYVIYNVFFFFSSRRRHTRFSRDWSSDVCSSHLTDRLTGLLNRGTWENLVDAEFERYRRYGHATALIMFDIDHFKPVNDTYGHLAGDEVIRHTAQVTRNHIRQSDSAGRYGGAERS